jgi:hypothetical protein
MLLLCPSVPRDQCLDCGNLDSIAWLTDYSRRHNGWIYGFTWLRLNEEGTHLSRLTMGRLTVNAVPRPGALATEIVPL